MSRSVRNVQKKDNSTFHSGKLNIQKPEGLLKTITEHTS